MSIDPKTLKFYEENAPRYTMSFGLSYSRHLDAFLDRLKPGADVLELGCGGGRDAARIREREFVLDATDGIAAMAKKANERFDVGARVMAFDQLDADQEYDAVWAHACLLHCPRAELPGILARIHRALQPGGWHFANFKLGTGEGRDLLGRLHNFPTGEWLIEQYRTAEFTIEETQVYAGDAADGTQRDWLALTVRKA